MGSAYYYKIQKNKVDKADKEAAECRAKIKTNFWEEEQKRASSLKDWRC
jgi:hypothetical protein